MELTRRHFLQASAVCAGTAVLAPRFVFSSTAGSPNDVLVVIFQRGAMDCLQAVVPYGDSNYLKQRPNIGIPAPGATNGALPLDNFFGLHPSLAPLMPLYQSGRLGIVHATGLKQNQRSHFECQRNLEAGLPTTGFYPGWLNRHIGNIGVGQTFQAVAVGTAVPAVLQGPQPAIGMSSISEFSFKTNSTRKIELEDTLYALSDSTAKPSVSGRQALDAVDFLAVANPKQYPLQNGAIYPNTTFGNRLKEVAQLIKSNIGLQMASVDIGGWDHHSGIVNAMPPLLDELAKSLVAFHDDLGILMNKVTVITMTEFGRRVKENSSGGTDHGSGSSMFMMGASVNGGKVYAQWPGLADANLFNGDLDVTIDYRTILNELMHKRGRDSNLAAQFPGFTPGPWLGCFKKENLETSGSIKPPKPIYT
jgi:uncharacterized protein (DUF1501 family)